MNVKTRTLGKLIALSLVTSTMLHATNGDNLIAVGTKARGMGGVSIAMSHGAESGITNPALITSVESSEIGFGGTVFMPDVKTTFEGDMEYTSDADLSLIPGVSIAHKVDNNWYVGIGMWGTAGMGTDYSDAANPMSANNLNMVTNLQLMQFAVPIAYKTEGLSLAVAPVVQYGNLDINYDMTVIGGGPVGAGIAQDFGFGYNLGLAYEVGNGLTLGAMYKSSIEMSYDNQLSTATGPFVMMGIFPAPMADDLEQPEEYGVGFAYEMGQHTFAFDYKKIKWSEAKGYKDFGWEDSDVYAVGYQYTENEWTVRLGYNRASSAVVELPNADTVAPYAALNFFNLLGFPATVEEHYTVGASYEFTNSFSVDLAYVYSPETTDTFDISALGAYGIASPSISTSHAQDAISFQLAYKF
jgi:long-chain fatty acid transport protein